jgi:hypothetical protein
MKLETLKQMMREVIDQVRDGTDVDDLSDQEIGKLIEYAMYEILNPPKQSVRDRILNEVTTDDRPCDTEAPDNVVRVNFK